MDEKKGFIAPWLWTSIARQVPSGRAGLSFIKTLAPDASKSSGRYEYPSLVQTIQPAHSRLSSAYRAASGRMVFSKIDVTTGSVRIASNSFISSTSP